MALSAASLQVTPETNTNIPAATVTPAQAGTTIVF